MQLKRFTFGDTGIFHALKLLENEEILEPQDEADLEWAEIFFNKNLIIPDIYRELADRRLISFFTPKGLQKFSDPINTFKRLFLLAEYAGLGLWKETVVNSRNLLIGYQDEYQVIGSVIQQES